jgi:phosphatidylglycerophosphate synthase
LTWGIYVNPANAITASRYLTLPPFLYFLHRGDIHWAAVMVLLSGAGDLLDGPVARLCKCTSGFGELFDAITDAICYGFCLAVLTVYGFLPWIPMALAAVLTGFNGWMRGAYARRAGRATNYRSYAMERMVAFAAYTLGCGLSSFSGAFYAWCLPIAMLVVVVHDYKRMLVDPIPEPIPGPVPTVPA